MWSNEPHLKESSKVIKRKKNMKVIADSSEGPPLKCACMSKIRGTHTWKEKWRGSCWNCVNSGGKIEF